MKYRTTAFLALLVSLLLSLTVPASAGKTAETAKTPEPRLCGTSKELSEYVLQLVAKREEHISVSIPKTLPEADMKGTELLGQILQQDSGYSRWGHHGGSAKKTIKSDRVVFEYKLTYRTTKKQDEEARRLAAGLVAKWGDMAKLPDSEKVGLLKTHISANWRYDDTLANMNAYSTFKEGKGTCLGMTMASQLLFDEMGIQSRMIHGTLTDTGVIHIRLLVKLGELWYTFDPTFLARKTPVLSAYLKQDHGKEFVPDAEYLTDSFKKAYPMVPGDINGDKI